MERSGNFSGLCTRDVAQPAYTWLCNDLCGIIVVRMGFHQHHGGSGFHHRGCAHKPAVRLHGGRHGSGGAVRSGHKQRRYAYLECHYKRALAVRSTSIRHSAVSGFRAGLSCKPERGDTRGLHPGFGHRCVQHTRFDQRYAHGGTGSGVPGGLAPGARVQLHGRRHSSGCARHLDHEHWRRNTLMGCLGQRRMGRAFLCVGHGSGKDVGLGESGYLGGGVLLSDGADYRDGRNRQPCLRVRDTRSASSATDRQHHFRG